MIVFSVLNRLVTRTRADAREEGGFPDSAPSGPPDAGNAETASPSHATRPDYGYAQREQIVTRQEFEAYRAAVRKDLEWLLNTRRIALPLPEGLKEVERSVYNYGLPDFSQLNLHPGRSAGDQARLAELIAAVIRTFEPRILDVKVAVSHRDTMQNVRFQVSGRLKMKPRPEPIFYDTTLDVTRGDYAVQISGEAHAS